VLEVIVHELNHARHPCFRVGDDTSGITRFLNPPPQFLGFDKLTDVIEDPSVMTIESIVLASGVAIPNAHVHPTTEGIARVDFVFPRDDKIWRLGDAVTAHAFERVVERSSGIDDPGGAFAARLIELRGQRQFKRRCMIFVDEGAVEIKAIE
jgi:hypothetical protein